VDEQYSPDRSELYDYRLDRILGRGGTGTVYRGIHKKTGQVAAIKLFRADFFRNRLHVRDLAKCAKKFRKFDHRNVVKIYDFVSGKDGECIVMEFVDGPNLRWYIENRPYNMRERLLIVTQICNGMAYLHEQGYVHHDFKPANVLFTRRGVAKVSDYSLYGHSVLLGMFDPGMHDQVTPMYVAPEFLRKEKATPKSDQYSLGVTLYVLFAGRVPFEVDNLQRLYECHLMAVPDHPSTVNRECPEELGDIIMRLLEKKPAKRFRDCDQVRIALSEIGRSRI